MRSKTYIRLFFVILVTAASFVLFSYARTKTSAAEPERSSECGGKSCEQKAQSEFILWESLTRNLLSARS